MFFLLLLLQNCLYDNTTLSRSMRSLRSHQHQVYGETVQKVALSPLDTKRYILEDGIRTHAIGYGKNA